MPVNPLSKPHHNQQQEAAEVAAAQSVLMNDNKPLMGRERKEEVKSKSVGRKDYC